MMKMTNGGSRWGLGALGFLVALSWQASGQPRACTSRSTSPLRSRRRRSARFTTTTTPSSTTRPEPAALYGAAPRNGPCGATPRAGRGPRGRRASRPTPARVERHAPPRDVPGLLPERASASLPSWGARGVREAARRRDQRARAPRQPRPQPARAAAPARARTEYVHVTGSAEELGRRRSSACGSWRSSSCSWWAATARSAAR